MTILEILFLILLSISLTVNLRLWMLYKCYKQAWIIEKSNNIVSTVKKNPIGDIVALIAGFAFGYYLTKKFVFKNETSSKS